MDHDAVGVSVGSPTESLPDGVILDGTDSANRRFDGSLRHTTFPAGALLPWVVGRDWTWTEIRGACGDILRGCYGGRRGTGGAEDPWRTIQFAAKRAQPGDTVIVRPGIYAESVTLSHSGTADMPIRYQLVPGAVLESPDPSASLSAFDFQPGIGHVIVDGLEARGGFHETVFLRPGSHDIQIRNCDIHDNRAGIWLSGVADVEVAGCHLHHNSSHGLRVMGNSRRVTVRDTTSDGNDDGLGCEGNADGFIVEQESAQVVFSDCRALANGEDGFDLQGNDVQLIGVESRGNNCGGVKLYQSANITNSLIAGNNTGIETTSFYNAPIAIAIRNSTIVSNRGTQIYLGDPMPQDGVAPAAYSVQIQNAIVYGPGKAIESMSLVQLSEDHDLLFREDTTSGLIVVHSGSSIERYTGQEINAGLWTSATGQGAGTWAIDPQFADSDSYEITPDSVAVDTAQNEGTPVDDKLGNPRPQGGGVDRGAYELPFRVSNHHPWADPGPDRVVSVGSSIHLQAFGSIDPDLDDLTYSWDLGDGSDPQSGFEVRHVYSGIGRFEARLTVSDGYLTDSRSAFVDVVPIPSPTPTAATSTPTSTAMDTVTETPSSVADPSEVVLPTVETTSAPSASATSPEDTPTYSPTITPTSEATPSPTQIPTPSFTATQTPSVHDSSLRPLSRPVRVRLRRGHSFAVKSIRLRVRNDDVKPVEEDPGHEIQVVADTGDCPKDVLLSRPDFDRRTRGSQDSALVAGGRRKTVMVTLRVDSGEFFSPSARAPDVCHLRFVVRGPGIDPTPEDDGVEVEVQVIDHNDF